MVFTPLSETKFKFKVTSLGTVPKVISMMKANKLAQDGAWAILASVVDTKKEKVSLETLSVVNEFPNVFLEDLPRIPPT